MEHAWIALAVMAALMQAVRTAAQKTLNQRMSTMGTTYVRSVFGLPIMLAHLAVVIALTGGSSTPPLKPLYLLYTFLGALAQVLATALLIRMFRLRNFAVGTMLTKVDIVMTAVIGMALFSEKLTLYGFAALLIVLAGVILMSLGKSGFAGLTGGSEGILASFASEATRVALGCAFLFTLSYLFLREATLVIAADGSAAWRGGWTVVIATGMQVLFLGAWLVAREPATFGQIRPNLSLSAFIGLTSAIGSIGWFTAFAMQNASYVRAVGQIEVVFTVLISWLYFRERIRPLEYAGIALTVLGVVMFRIYGI
jgi:drug/metabolite transporter (DMT)-like permease